MTTKITTLQQHPHLLSEVSALIEDALEYSPSHSFATDFYPLIKKDNHRHLYVLLENDTPVAHVGLLPKSLNLRGRSFPVALIGGVATAQDKRGRGYFDCLIKHIFEKHPRYMGYFLWGGLDSFYKKYGFHQMGVVREQKGAFHPPPGYTSTLYKDLEPQHKRQLQEIHRLGTRNLTCVERDWSDIEKMTSARLFIKPNKQSEITHYFFVGKGQDLPGIVHEAFGTGELSGLPCWMPDVPPFTRWPMLYGCLFKIGDPILFTKFIARYCENTLEVLNVGDEQVTFSFHGQTMDLSIEDFLCGLFGPGLMEEFKDFYGPLWFGGLDSI